MPQFSKIYRYLDKLSDHQHEIVQDISVHHTAKLFGDNIGVLFYDVTTLGSWSAIQMTVLRKMPITERREYADWKRHTSMVRSLKAIKKYLNYLMEIFG